MSHIILCVCFDQTCVGKSLIHRPRNVKLFSFDTTPKKLQATEQALKVFPIKVAAPLCLMCVEEVVMILAKKNF